MGQYNLIASVLSHFTPEPLHICFHLESLEYYELISSRSDESISLARGRFISIIIRVTFVCLKFSFYLFFVTPESLKNLKLRLHSVY